MDNQEKGNIIAFPVLANGDEYRVVCDDDGKNFILEKMQPVNKKDGSIQYIWKLVGFYGSVLEALQRVLRAFRPNRDVTSKNTQKCCQRPKKRSQKLSEKYQA